MITTIGQLENAILEKNTEQLQLRDFTLNENENLDDFIVRLLRKYTYEHHTVDENDELICTKGIERRSLGTIYRLCKHYFPECSLKEILNELTKQINNKTIGSYYCSDVKKRVYKYAGYGYHGWTTSDKDEYELYDRDYEKLEE